MSISDSKDIFSTLILPCNVSFFLISLDGLWVDEHESLSFSSSGGVAQRKEEIQVFSSQALPLTGFIYNCAENHKCSGGERFYPHLDD